LVSIRLKVGPKGQIVIPKVFREAYGINEGGGENENFDVLPLKRLWLGG